MPYVELSQHQMHRLALDIPQRNEVQEFHQYCNEVNSLRAMKDDVISTIPEEWRELIGGEDGTIH